MRGGAADGTGVMGQGGQGRGSKDTQAKGGPGCRRQAHSQAGWVAAKCRRSQRPTQSAGTRARHGPGCLRPSAPGGPDRMCALPARSSHLPPGSARHAAPAAAFQCRLPHRWQAQPPRCCCCRHAGPRGSLVCRAARQQATPEQVRLALQGRQGQGGARKGRAASPPRKPPQEPTASAAARQAQPASQPTSQPTSQPARD